MGLLQDKVIAITGGAAGMGRAHAIASAREGADVLLIDVLDPDGEVFGEAVKLVEAEGRRALAVRADTTKQEELDAAVARGVAELGGIDGLIINAGIFRFGQVWEMSEPEWNQILDINLTGAWKAAKAVTPHFRERGAGSLVLISSIDATDPVNGGAAYCVSKAGLQMLTKCLAFELGRFGVRANAIAPGYIDTAMINTQASYDRAKGGPGGTRDDLLEKGLRNTAIGGVTLLDPSNVADAAVFLNSDRARAISGTTVPVEAGNLVLPRVHPDPSTGQTTTLAR